LKIFRIRLLGELSIAYQDKQIQDTDNRSRKVWLLLAYMIYFRNRTITTEELIYLLWSNEDSSSNPSNALKTMFHRVRSTLDQLGPDVGRNLIIRRQGGYTFNTELSFDLDILRFEALCQNGKMEKDPQVRLASYLEALELYQGDFLPKLSTEAWVIPISAYYHSLYLQTTHEVLAILEETQQTDLSATICRRAIEIEPYDEQLYASLMRYLLRLGEHQVVIALYANISEILFSQFGVTPSEELRSLHREAMRSSGDRELDLHSVRSSMLTDASLPGALYCEYDFFKSIYNAEARSVSRNGTVIHVALLNVKTAKGSALPKRSLDRCMDNLEQLLRGILRRGDVVSRCSASQYILLLPNANYENSCMVLDRIVRRFGRQYPHSPAFLRYSIQPLDPA